MASTSPYEGEVSLSKRGGRCKISVIKLEARQRQCGALSVISLAADR
jgi:hypothetical protein